jgi:hypothetical protein
MESNSINDQIQQDEAATFNTSTHLEIIHHRKRPTDPDGCSAKAAIDGIVAAGILPDDSAKWIESIKITVIQSVVEKTIFRFTEV